MKIKYSRKRLYANLISGLLFITLWILTLFSKDDFVFWGGFVYLILGIDKFSQFIYDCKHQYLLIKNGSIQQFKLFGSKTTMGFDEVQTIEKLDGNYILKSETKKLEIKIDLIDNTSLLKLMEVLKNIDLPPEKSYFSRFKNQN